MKKTCIKKITGRIDGEAYFDGSNGKMYSDRQGRIFGEAAEALAHYQELEESVLAAAEIDLDNLVGEYMHYYNLQKENRLVELPCDKVYYVVDRGTAFAMVMSKPIEQLPLFQVRNIDKDGLHWSTYEKAEKQLKESKGEAKNE